MALNNVLFFLGLVFGQVRRQPARAFSALRAPMVRCFLITATALKKITHLLWATVQFLGFGLSSVVLLLILANTLLSSELAIWASLFVLGGSPRVLGGRFRNRPSSARNVTIAEEQSLAVSASSSSSSLSSAFDEAAYAATLTALADVDLRRKARGITNELRSRRSLTAQERFERAQQRRVIYKTLDDRRAPIKRSQADEL